MMTNTYPFLHYQIHALGLIESLTEPEDASFLPIGQNRCLFNFTDVSVNSLVYNIYFYTEDDIFVESFVHDFDISLPITDFVMEQSGLMVRRTIADAFPRVGHLTAQAKRLSVWQFSDKV